MPNTAAITRRLAPFCGIAVLAAISGCSTTTVTVPAPATASSVTVPASAAASSVSVLPGNGSPEQAVAGMLRDRLAGDWSGQCQYMSYPFAQPGVCPEADEKTGPAATGSYRIAGQTISGTDALVFVTGSICYADGGGCLRNSDPTAGAPSSPADFDAAFGAAANAGYSFSPIACYRINGQWYVSGFSWT